MKNARMGFFLNSLTPQSQSQTCLYSMDRYNYEDHYEINFIGEIANKLLPGTV